MSGTTRPAFDNLADLENGAILEPGWNHNISDDRNTNAADSNAPKLSPLKTALCQVVFASILVGSTLMMGRFYAYIPEGRVPESLSALSAWLGYYLCALMVVVSYCMTALFDKWNNQRPFREWFNMGLLRRPGLGIACCYYLVTMPIFCLACRKVLEFITET